jgi:hypothetical protein
MGKTKKIYKNNKGGKVIASGGYGCVFNPVLKCEGTTERETNKISKLMTERHATQEYEEINNIKEKLNSIPNYEDYFLLYDATLCRPAKLTNDDLDNFNNKCSALPKDNITKANINSKLDQVLSLNMPNGGLPVDDYIYSDGSFLKIYKLHNKLVNLLKNGIIPMNKHHIYHCDIKDSNVLVDDSGSELKTRLIDWGLSLEYKAGDKKFPNNFRNRPLQFNVPFSVIIFTDSFIRKYSKYLKEGGKNDNLSLRPFVLNYLNSWIKERGAGHYKFINEIMYKLYSNELTNITEKNKPIYIETQFTVPHIINYIVHVLIHWTKFRKNGDLNLREYLNEVYIKIVDVYGFISTYYPVLELLHSNYDSLDSDKLELFDQLKMIYKKYLFSPRYKAYDMTELDVDFEIFDDILKNIVKGETPSNKTPSNKTPENELKVTSVIPNESKKRCPKGSRKNKKTGNCEQNKLIESIVLDIKSVEEPEKSIKIKKCKDPNKSPTGKNGRCVKNKTQKISKKNEENEILAVGGSLSNNFLFNRKPLIKRFKNPLFLSLK